MVRKAMLVVVFRLDILPDLTDLYYEHTFITYHGKTT